MTYAGVFHVQNVDNINFSNYKIFSTYFNDQDCVLTLEIVLK